MSDLTDEDRAAITAWDTSVRNELGSGLVPGEDWARHLRAVYLAGAAAMRQRAAETATGGANKFCPCDQCITRMTAARTIRALPLTEDK